MLESFSPRSRLARNFVSFFFFLALSAFGVAISSSEPKPIHPRAASQTQTTRKTSTPYTGDLSIFEEKGRDERLQINRVMDILKIQAGSNVADIGAGSGWFTVRAAKRVGSAGLVYAEDINPAAIAYIQKRAQRDGIQNLRPILGKEGDPLLPESSVDAVLILKTYHEFAHPTLVLENLRKSLRPGALVGIIDRNGAGDDHGINREVVLEEARRADYILVEQYDFVKPDHEDYFLVFRVREANQ